MEWETNNREDALNFLKYGDEGDMVWMDETKRCVIRAQGLETTMPTCRLYEDWNPQTEKGKYIGYAVDQWDAVAFLYGEEIEEKGYLHNN